ncbi:MAG: hypothetical protein AAGE61_01545 [Pseudomonadota bacterium]
MAARMTIGIKAGAILSLASGLLFSPVHLSPADAQQGRCTDHKSLTSHLEKKYGEKARSIGMVSEQGVMQVYVSEKGTWTILLTNPHGQACLIAAGKGWEDLKVIYEDPEA